MEWLQLLETLGFPIACTVALGYFIYKLVLKLQDDARDRENRLLDNNKDAVDTIAKVANTIEQTNKVNKELSETNRLMAEKMENRLIDMDGKIDNIIEKVENIGG